MATDSDREVREGLSSITRGTLFLLFATLGFVVLNFVSRVVVVRSILPGDFSAFSLGLSLAGLLSAFGTLGLTNAVARGIPHAASDAERRTIVRSTFAIGSVAAVASSALLWVFAGPIGRALGQPGLTLALEFFPVAVATSIIGSLVASIFQGFEDVTPNALFLQLVNPGLFVVFLGIAIVVPPSGIDYREALATYALANVVTLALILVYAGRQLPRRLPRGPLAPEALGPLLRFAAPLFVVGIMGSITASGDTILLGAYHFSETGTYSASLTLARLLQIGIGAAGYIFLPVATKFLRQNDSRSIQLTYATVTKWMTLVSLPLFLVFFFFPSPSLGLVYGPRYVSVVEPLQLAVLGAFLTTILGPSTMLQVAFGQTRLLMYNSIAAGVVDVGLALLLVPGLGYVGAAVAWAVANSLFTGLSLVELAVLSGVHPFRRHFVAPLLATALPITVVFVVTRPLVSGLGLVVLALVLAGLFVLLVLLTRSVDDGDRLLLEAVERLIGRRLSILRRLGRIGLRSTR